MSKKKRRPAPYALAEDGALKPRVEPDPPAQRDLPQYREQTPEWARLCGQDAAATAKDPEKAAQAFANAERKALEFAATVAMETTPVVPDGRFMSSAVPPTALEQAQSEIRLLKAENERLRQDIESLRASDKKKETTIRIIEATVRIAMEQRQEVVQPS